MPHSNHRRPLDSESVISLLFLGVGAAFWAVFVVFMLVGETPVLLGL